MKLNVCFGGAGRHAYNPAHYVFGSYLLKRTAVINTVIAERDLLADPHTQAQCDMARVLACNKSVSAVNTACKKSGHINIPFSFREKLLSFYN
jgi:hypothetical protein